MTVKQKLTADDLNRMMAAMLKRGELTVGDPWAADKADRADLSPADARFLLNLPPQCDAAEPADLEPDE
jgi:hypothetical protein